jgi:hypothetical protein
MANDIFGLDSTKRPNLAGGFRFASTSVMAFTYTKAESGAAATSGGAGTAYEGLVTQNVQLNYNQAVTRIKGINTQNQYRVIAPAEGTGTIVAAIMNGTTFTDFIKTFGNPCSTGNNLYIKGLDVDTCPGSASTTVGVKKLDPYVLTGVIIEGIQLSCTLEQLYFAGNITFQFISMNA